MPGDEGATTQAARTGRGPRGAHEWVQNVPPLSFVNVKPEETYSSVPTQEVDAPTGIGPWPHCFGFHHNDMTHCGILLEFMHVTTVAIDIARIFSDKFSDWSEFKIVHTFCLRYSESGVSGVVSVSQKWSWLFPHSCSHSSMTQSRLQSVWIKSEGQMCLNSKTLAFKAVQRNHNICNRFRQCKRERVI